MACKKCGYDGTPESKWPHSIWGVHCPICYFSTNAKHTKVEKQQEKVKISEFGEHLLSAMKSKILIIKEK